jgi:hypothetical protein
VLLRAALRAPLLAAVADADRVVLLGDVLELRHGPAREVISASRPFFEDLGAAIAGRELIVVAGNHDHALIEPWLARRGETDEPPPLGVEQLLEPAQASPVLERIARWAAPATVRVAYPGLWLRPDMYATHGHYLDCHMTVPTLERLSLGALGRLLGRPASASASVDDYEALGSPLFAFRDAVVRDAPAGAALNGAATVGAWRALRGGDVGGGRLREPARRLRRDAIAGAFSLTVAALNRAGLGPLRADVSTSELRRAGLRAMGEVAARLQLGDAYVVFGHTHRAGPFPGDEEHEWRGRDGARLVNVGSWTYAPIFLSAAPGESPYWPGVCALIDDDGPPLLKRLLQERTHAQLRPRPRPRAAVAQ